MERIQTLHPEAGKQGVHISREKYDQVRAGILDALANGPLTLSALFDAVTQRLGPTFEGSPTWYTMSVKLDLEARGEIERVPKVSPQQLRLKRKT
jgi:hypothetical protein